MVFQAHPMLAWEKKKNKEDKCDQAGTDIAYFSGNQLNWSAFFWQIS